MAGIKKVGHVVLAVHDPQRSIKFYTEALGMECVRYLEDFQMAFFSFGDERGHDIAVIKVPDDQTVGSGPGLAHTALEIDGDEEELRRIYSRIKSYGATVELTADHIMSKSFYFLDPDGNRIEIFAQMQTPADEKRTFREASSAHELLKPLDLEVAAPAN